jgi:hypothetical protein
MAIYHEPSLIFQTDCDGYYVIKILDKTQNKIIHCDTLKSENKQITIKGFTPNNFEIIIEPIQLTNYWEKILLL